MPTPPPPADADRQLAAYRCAVQALGGISEHARLLGMGKRHGQRIHAGAFPLSAAIIADTAAALLDRADRCRQLERQLSPAFAANLTERQRTASKRGRRRGAEPSIRQAAQR